MKNFIFITLVICLALFLFNKARSPKAQIASIKRSYKGIIVEIYYNKAFHFKIRNDENKIIDITDQNGPLSKIAVIGDTLFKKPNENYFYLIKKDGTVFKGSSEFIENYHRNSSEWPKEWKNKWLENETLHKVEKLN